ncbi:MAG: Sun protein, partial [Myxococcota bacterium]|nr:Sun protein [Myxococcota bacterium]
MAKLPSVNLAPTGRRIAARVIGRVLFDEAYAAAALDAELSRASGLDPREKGLATEIAYGVLRMRPALLARIQRHVKKLPKDEVTLLHLLVAAYQLLVLERVPAFAAVNAAVEAVREERGKPLAGFVNAVLRKLAASGERLDPRKAVLESGPRWLVERLVESVGEDEAAALFGATGAPSPTLRLLSGRPLPDWLAST